jgi:hypothetical protein
MVVLGLIPERMLGLATTTTTTILVLIVLKCGSREY